MPARDRRAESGARARRPGAWPADPLGALLGLVAPPACWACGAAARPHEPLCQSCRGRLRWLGEDPTRLAGVEVWAPVAYDGPARALVRGLKFRGAVGLADPLAAQIAACAPAELLRPPTALVPVPLDPARARARGYNQAERLAAAVARRAGMRVCDCLRRVPRRRRGFGTATGGGRQVGRGRAQRLVALAGMVEARAGAAVPARVLLVDDVVTTGGTLSACAAALYAAGASDVAAIAYALTPGS